MGTVGPTGYYVFLDWCSRVDRVVIIWDRVNILRYLVRKGHANTWGYSPLIVIVVVSNVNCVCMLGMKWWVFRWFTPQYCIAWHLELLVCLVQVHIIMMRCITYHVLQQFCCVYVYLILVWKNYMFVTSDVLIVLCAFVFLCVFFWCGVVCVTIVVVILLHWLMISFTYTEEGTTCRSESTDLPCTRQKTDANEENSMWLIPDENNTQRD